MTSISKLEQSFTAMLYRPFFDLGPLSEESTLQLFGIDFDYIALTEGISCPQLQQLFFSSFRDELIQFS